MKNRIVCGMNEKQELAVLNEKVVGATSVWIEGLTEQMRMSASCRHHAIQLEESGCYYIYDCVVNATRERCVWSGRVICVVIS